jgi:hypothetical protein
MTTRIKAEKFLSFWEESWGKLSPEWSANFLEDPRTKQILEYPGLLILNAVQQFKKLDEILTHLEGSSVPEKSRLSSKVEASPQPVNSKKAPLTTPAELQIIHEWLTRMSVAKFDPDSTFPRLIIKSDKETCQSKRKYKSEPEAISALIKLEEVSGDLIKQLPYRCNICLEFHNTHLISRETIQKLLRKYQPHKKR